MERLNPRGARIVALGTPSERERGQCSSDTSGTMP
jgi:polyphosphate kinase 2 (PPK2 family)